MSAQDFTIPPPLGRALHRVQQRSLIVGGVALVICVIGALFSPDQFFRSYLFSYLFYLGMTLGCMDLVMLQYLSGGSWGIIIRRITESATRTIPLLAFLFLPILIGIRKLYSWSHEEVVKAGNPPTAAQAPVPECAVLHCPRADLLRRLVGFCAFPEQVVTRTGHRRT